MAQFNTIVPGSFVSSPYLGSTPGIYVSQDDENMYEHRIYSRKGNYESCTSVHYTDIRLLSFEPINEFSSYITRQLQDYISTLSPAHIRRQLLSSSRNMLRVNEIDYRLVVLIDTFYIPLVLTSPDAFVALTAAKSALQRSCRKRALNNYAYSKICSYYMSKAEDIAYKQRIAAAFDEMIKDFHI